MEPQRHAVVDSSTTKILFIGDHEQCAAFIKYKKDIGADIDNLKILEVELREDNE